MDIKLLVSTVAAVFPLFPQSLFDITCTNKSIPGEYALDHSTGDTYYLMKPKFTLVADGLIGAEGPVFDKQGNFYVATPFETVTSGTNEDKIYKDRWAGKLYKIDLNSGEKTVVCEPQVDNFGGRPVGCATDKNGTIWIADLRLGLLKYDPRTGSCEQQATIDTDGNRLAGLDDLIFDDGGNLWITGPSTPIAPVPENITKASMENIGVLYYLPKGGKNLARIPRENFRFNNGIVVKGKLLLQSESFTGRIIAFDITGPGQVANRRVWAELSKVLGKMGWPSMPDGIDFDAAGNLLVSHIGSGFIEVFSPNGRLVGKVKCPFERPSNLQFAPDSCTCYVTDHETSAVYKFDWVCKGWPTYADSQ